MRGKMTVLRAEPRKDFVVTPWIETICERAIAYLNAGFPVHLRGPAGTGKTTLAMHLAGLRGKPVMLIYGDEGFSTSELVGGHKGVISKRIVDNFIHSVLKTEEDVRAQWVDQRLTLACKYGYTLIYDEFCRSRPEANNVLLGVLEEKLLALPESHCGESYLQVHDDFRAIFTSNPEEYAGVYRAQDALLDRVITLELSHYDRETEVAITMAKAVIPRAEAEKIVDIVREIRANNAADSRPSIRASIMIGSVLAARGASIQTDGPLFFDTCIDVLGADGRNGKKKSASMAKRNIEHVLAKHLSSNGGTGSEEGGA